MPAKKSQPQGGGGGIRCIDASSAKLITAGQVIVGLSSVVKELVENSIDAKAKEIIISVIDFGLTSITCSDDGEGFPIASAAASSAAATAANGGGERLEIVPSVADDDDNVVVGNNVEKEKTKKFSQGAVVGGRGVDDCEGESGIGIGTASNNKSNTITDGNVSGEVDECVDESEFSPLRRRASSKFNFGIIGCSTNNTNANGDADGNAGEDDDAPSSSSLLPVTAASLGFRGEALFSLAQHSDVCIETRNASEGDRVARHGTRVLTTTGRAVIAPAQSNNNNSTSTNNGNNSSSSGGGIRVPAGAPIRFYARGANSNNNAVAVGGAEDPSTSATSQAATVITIPANLRRPANKVGTTVHCYNLFARYPVRLADYVKNRKRHVAEAARAVRLLAIAHPSIRIVLEHRENQSITNFAQFLSSRGAAAGAEAAGGGGGANKGGGGGSGNGKVERLVITSGSADTFRTLTEVVGGRLTATLQRIRWVIDLGAAAAGPKGSGGDDPSDANNCKANGKSEDANSPTPPNNCNNSSSNTVIVIEGFVSKIGSGRASGEYHQLTLDGRVVGLPRLFTALTETYRHHSANCDSRTFPAAFLWLSTHNNVAVDVNLAPNKEKILLDREGEIVAAVAERAAATFRANVDAVPIVAVGERGKAVLLGGTTTTTSTAASGKNSDGVVSSSQQPNTDPLLLLPSAIEEAKPTATAKRDSLTFAAASTAEHIPSLFSSASSGAGGGGGSGGGRGSGGLQLLGSQTFLSLPLHSQPNENYKHNQFASSTPLFAAPPSAAAAARSSSAAASPNQQQHQSSTQFGYSATRVFAEPSQSDEAALMPSAAAAPLASSPSVVVSGGTPPLRIAIVDDDDDDADINNSGGVATTTGGTAAGGGVLPQRCGVAAESEDAEGGTDAVVFAERQQQQRPSGGALFASPMPSEQLLAEAKAASARAAVFMPSLTAAAAQNNSSGHHRIGGGPAGVGAWANTTRGGLPPLPAQIVVRGPKGGPSNNKEHHDGVDGDAMADTFGDALLVSPPPSAEQVGAGKKAAAATASEAEKGEEGGGGLFSLPSLSLFNPKSAASASEKAYAAAAAGGGGCGGCCGGGEVTDVPSATIAGGCCDVDAINGAADAAEKELLAIYDDFLYNSPIGLDRLLGAGSSVGGYGYDDGSRGNCAVTAADDGSMLIGAPTQLSVDGPNLSQGEEGISGVGGGITPLRSPNTHDGTPAAVAPSSSQPVQAAPPSPSLAAGQVYAGNSGSVGRADSIFRITSASTAAAASFTSPQRLQQNSVTSTLSLGRIGGGGSGGGPHLLRVATAAEIESAVVLSPSQPMPPQLSHHLSEQLRYSSTLLLAHQHQQQQEQQQRERSQSQSQTTTAVAGNDSSAPPLLAASLARAPSGSLGGGGLYGVGLDGGSGGGLSLPPSLGQWAYSATTAQAQQQGSLPSSAAAPMSMRRAGGGVSVSSGATAAVAAAASAAADAEHIPPSAPLYRHFIGSRVHFSFPTAAAAPQRSHSPDAADGEEEAYDGFYDGYDPTNDGSLLPDVVDFNGGDGDGADNADDDAASAFSAPAPALTAQDGSLLSSMIRKNDFFDMRVVGQFNRGFIVVTLPHDVPVGSDDDDNESDDDSSFSSSSSSSRSSSLATTEKTKPKTAAAKKRQREAAVDKKKKLTQKKKKKEGDDDVPRYHHHRRRRVERILSTFIVDQHASDEKCNYERLLTNLQIRSQPLLRPASVHCDAAELELAIEHKDALAAHGFLVDREYKTVVVERRRRGEDDNEDDAVDGNGDGGEGKGGEVAAAVANANSTTLTTAKVAVPNSLLVSGVPVLAYHSIKATDVLELTQQLVLYGKIVRRMRAVWHSVATRACRSSIMIGKTLDCRVMERILRRMGALDQPWACPHGRPTMRFLGHVRESGGGSLSLRRSGGRSALSSSLSSSSHSPYSRAYFAGAEAERREARRQQKRKMRGKKKSGVNSRRALLEGQQRMLALVGTLAQKGGSV